MGYLREYNSVICLILNIFDPRVPCKHGCRWMTPFGYVRTAGCPKHD
jgi:hypothetical protein